MGGSAVKKVSPHAFTSLFHTGACHVLPGAVASPGRSSSTAWRRARKAVRKRLVSLGNCLPLRLLVLCLLALALCACALVAPEAGTQGGGGAVTRRALRRGSHRSQVLALPLADAAAASAWVPRRRGRTAARRGGPPPPRLRIPRTIHQTVPYGKPGGRAAALRASWATLNPGWTVKLYTDTHAAAFVAAEFPQYLSAYYALPKPAGRADLFRVLVLLRRGGVYADADAACVRPLDQLLRQGDTLVMGWENTFEAPRQAMGRHYVRQRQMLNWAMAATPGHPALSIAAAAIVARAPEFQHAPDRLVDPRGWQTFVLEHSGPGVVTDTLLTWYTSQNHNTSGDASRQKAPYWSVRVLPRVAWGTHPRAGSADGVTQKASEVVVAHKFAGSWKRKQGVERLPWPLRPIARLFKPLWAPPPAPPLGPEAVNAAVRPAVAGTLYPVSCRVPLGLGPGLRTRAWDVLLPPPGARGLPGCHAGAALHLFNWGSQPPRTGPHGLSVLLQLARHTPGLVVDVGAGLGFYTLGAASANRRVVAFEPHLGAWGLLRTTVQGNPALRSRITVRQLALGAPQVALFNVAWGAANSRQGDAVAASRKAAAGVAEPETGSVLGAADGVAVAAAAGGGGERVTPMLSLDEALANVTAGWAPSAGQDGSSGQQVALLRVAARGWEGWALTGARDLLSGESPPVAVLVECVPDQLAVTGWGDAVMLVERMRAWGYSHAAHGGLGCDARVGRGDGGAGASPGTWCRLDTPGAALLSRLVPPGQSEALLFSRLPFESLLDAPPPPPLGDVTP